MTMAVKVSFVASDGKEFATEAECIIHEVEINPEKYKKFQNGVIMLHYMNGLILNGKQPVRRKAAEPADEQLT